MFGMYGVVYVNYVIDSVDLLFVFGVWFDDCVIGKLVEFVKRVVIVYIDIDSAEFGKNKKLFCFIFSNIKFVLKILNKLIVFEKDMFDFLEWCVVIDV